jgi:hypothetical protein
MKRILALTLCLAGTAVGQTVTPWEAGVPFIDPGGTVLDNVDGVIPWSQVVITGLVNVAALGAYPVHYSVKDSSGNEGIADRQVSVRDTKPPVITLKGANPTIIVQGTPLSSIELGAIATDSFAGAVPVAMMVSNAFGVVLPAGLDTTQLGTYILTYAAKDPSGNAAVVIKRTVKIVAPPDTTKPVITLK